MDWPLTTSLERALNDWQIGLDSGPSIEEQIVREFRRQYRGDDRDLVASDMLYCLALMQHHGAPTRLLDFTYSPFVAVKFAIEAGLHEKQPVVWCIQQKWCSEAAGRIVGKELMKKRLADKSRNDESFIPMFMPHLLLSGPGEPKGFVYPANALNRSQRLILQQGLFMCPGDARTSFLCNLREMDGWNSKENVVKLELKMDRKEFVDFSVNLRRMNVDSSVLFPTLDGFARSLRERMPFHESFAKRRIGKADAEVDSPF